MTKRWSLYLPLMLAMVLFSCAEESIEPEPVTPASGLTGEYDFVSVSIDAITTSENSQDGLTMKTVSKVVYTSKNNRGTYSFDGKNVIGTDVAYSVDTTLKTLFYTGDPDPIEVDMPFIVDLPPYSSAGTYRVIGTDSLFFEGGFISGPVSAGSPQMASPPSGGKFYFTGDILTLTARVDHSKTVTEMGMTVYTSTHGNTTVKLRKRK